jgi:hypothetical protein
MTIDIGTTKDGALLAATSPEGRLLPVCEACCGPLAAPPQPTAALSAIVSAHMCPSCF